MMANAKRKSDWPSFNRSPVPSIRISIGNDLDVVLDDRKIKTDPIENKNRRTIIVKRDNGSFGFTLQSYGLRRRNSDETELLSYVDYVEYGGPAQKAGMRAGDVILSVNGESMENADHAKLVNCIRNCQEALRMVVLFEDVCRKIELHLRYFKLQQVLAAKMYELRAIAYQEAKILEKVGAFGGAEESTSVAEMSDDIVSGSLGSSYFDYDSVDFTERMMSTPSVFCSSRELRFSDRSPDVSSLGSPLEPPRGTTAMSRSPGALSIGSHLSPSAHLSLSPGGSVITPSGPHISALPPPDDAFWNSSEFNYGSLPTRSRKRNFLSDRSYSSPRDAGSRSLAFRNHNNVRVSSTLFEEGDESQEGRINAVERKPEKKNATSKLSPSDYSSPTTSMSTAKTLSKISASVPNLIRLKSIGSPFLARKSKNPLQRSNSKVKENSGNLHVGRDPRVMTKQMREQISNYVMTEDLCRRPDDPQLLGLKQLCNDFRDSCFQQNLRQRRKSMDLMLKKTTTAAVRPPTLDLNSTSKDVPHRQRHETNPSSDLKTTWPSTNSKSELAGSSPDRSPTLSKATSSRNVKRSETAYARYHSPLSTLRSKADNDQQGSSCDEDTTAADSCTPQTMLGAKSNVALLESHGSSGDCAPDGSASVSASSSYFSSMGRGPTPSCLNADDEVTRL